MNFLHTDIGSAKDNLKSPIHNWYKFTAGFSYKFVDEIISLENLHGKLNSKIFDPFAGCGTTLVSSQKLKVEAVGNEGQEFMYDVIRAKLGWSLEKLEHEEYLKKIISYVTKNLSLINIEEIAHPLLKTLYTEETLKKLYLIRNFILSIKDLKYKLFYKLALSQTLHKVSIHPIAVPYISRNKTLNHTDQAIEFFKKICEQMFTDTLDYSDRLSTSKIFLQDSRFANPNINDGECNLCITSPPYLNNLDYGEVSKVHTHFFNITDNWNDITQNVRKKLVTGATTHYTESNFSLESFMASEFFTMNKNVGKNLIELSEQIKVKSQERSGKKSFDILSLLYFQDMYHVLKEVRRVVKHDSRAYLILGDSAPYGVFVPTTEILGEISKSVGFSSYEIHKIRTRGTKWKSLKHRHSLELAENVLILK